MSLPHSNDDFDDELLSAYVDDELTVEERALVVARLRTDPQAAQMVEELRALSSAIKSLPRESLGRDLRASVQAEAEEAKAEATPPDVLDVAPPFGRWAGYRRGLAWSAVAIAATLLLMVVVPEETARDAGTVAKVSDREGLARRNAEDATDQAPVRQQPTMRAFEEAKDESAPATAAGSLEDAPSASAAAAPEAPADGDAKQDAALGKKLEEQEKLAELQRAEEAPMAKADRADALSEDTALGAGAAADPSTSVADADASRARSLLAARKALPTKVELALKAPDGVERFEQLLVRHRIQLVPEPRESASIAYSQEFKRAIEGVDAEAAAEKRGEASTRSAAGLDADAGSPEAAMVVEASPDQIKDLLASCQSSDAFAEVQDDSKLVEAGQAAALAGEAGETPESGAEPWRRYAAGGFGGGIEQRAGSSSTPAAGEPAVAASGPVAAGDAAAQNAPPQSGRQEGERALGRAWRLPPVRLENGEAKKLAFGDRAKEQLEQRGGRDETGAALSPSADKPTGGVEAKRRSAAIAKAPAGAPQAEQIQVLFVLRSPPLETAAEAKAAQ